MESAESFPSNRYQETSPASHPALRGRLRDRIIVLQLDGAVSGVHGLSWLSVRRDDATLRRLADLQVSAMAEGWSHADYDRARLAVLRPRRAEVNALGQAYLSALAPGAVDAAHRLRSAGIPIELSGEVAVEAMLGVAGALGVTPDGVIAPRARFDALGAFVGTEAPSRPDSTGRAARAYIGTHASEVLAGQGSDVFVRFTGTVAHEGPPRADSVGSFPELVELLVG